MWTNSSWSHASLFHRAPGKAQTLREVAGTSVVAIIPALEEPSSLRSREVTGGLYLTLSPFLPYPVDLKKKKNPLSYKNLSEVWGIWFRIAG